MYTGKAVLASFFLKRVLLYVNAHKMQNLLHALFPGFHYLSKILLEGAGLCQCFLT